VEEDVRPEQGKTTTRGRRRRRKGRIPQKPIAKQEERSGDVPLPALPKLVDQFHHRSHQPISESKNKAEHSGKFALRLQKKRNTVQQLENLSTTQRHGKLVFFPNKRLVLSGHRALEGHRAASSGLALFRRARRYLKQDSVKRRTT